MRALAILCALAAAAGATPLQLPKPKQAEIFVRALRSKDTKVRRIALEHLSELADQPATAAAGDAIGKLALDPKQPTELREAALWVLVAMPAANAIDTLWPLLMSPSHDKTTGLAAIALAKHGAQRDRLAKILLVLVRMPDDFTSEAAAEALGALGPAVLPELRARLTAGNRGELRAVARALAIMGPAAAAAAPDVRTALAAAKSSLDRSALADALERITGGPSLDLVLEALAGKPTTLELFGIAHALEKLGAKAHSALDSLVARLDAENAGAILSAAEKLALPADHARLAKLAAPYVTAHDDYAADSAISLLAACGAPGRAVLEGALTSGTAATRVRVLRVADRLGDELARIEPLVHDSDARVRRDALYALAKYGTRAEATALAALADSDASMRVAATAVLAGSPTAKSIAALSHALDDSDRSVRDSAVGALAKLGPQAASAAPALLAAANKTFLARGDEALAALGPPVVPVLRTALASRETPTRRIACEALGKLKHAADAAVPDLVARLASDPDEGVRFAAIMAIEAIGAKQALPDVESALLDPYATTREVAARTVGELGGPSAAARRVLVDMVVHGDLAAENAIHTLVANGTPKDLVPALRALVATTNTTSMARTAAIRALVAANDRSPATLAALRHAMDHDESAYVRGPAAEAVLALGTDGDFLPALVVIDGVPDAQRVEDARMMRELNDNLREP